jgi:hypothetical protein
MRLEQIMLVVAGLMGIGAFFLPFLQFEQSFLGLKLLDLSLSGWSYTQAWLDYFGLYQSKVGAEVIRTLIQLWESASELKGKAQLAGIFFVMTGPVIYLLYSLGYLIRGLLGRSFKRGILFNLLFMPLAWGLMYWLSQDHSTSLFDDKLKIGLDLNFFSLAGPGYWLAFAAVFVAGFSLLFERKA